MMKKLIATMLMAAMLTSGAAMAEGTVQGVWNNPGLNKTITATQAPTEEASEEETAAEEPAAEEVAEEEVTITETPATEEEAPATEEASTTEEAPAEEPVTEELPEFVFRDGITWNSSVGAIAQVTGAAPIDDELMALYANVSDVYTAADVAVAGTTADALDFIFYNNAPFVISYSFHGKGSDDDLYEKLQSGLTLKYGAPASNDSTESFSVMESLFSNEAIDLPLQVGPVSIGPWHIGSVNIGKSESIEAIELENYCAWLYGTTRIYIAVEGEDLVIRYENIPAIEARTEAVAAADAATAIDGL